jgi:hypothetical protein
MERLSADGTAVRLSGPFPQTGVMQYMTANLNESYWIVILVVLKLTLAAVAAVAVGL